MKHKNITKVTEVELDKAPSVRETRIDSLQIGVKNLCVVRQ